MSIEGPTATVSTGTSFERGMEVLATIGQGGQDLVDSLADISPGLGEQIINWAFGEIYIRPGIARRERQFVTLGILTALGGCEHELDIHINAALNIGLTPEEIVETLVHSAVYCGIPRALNATMVAKKVFKERGIVFPPTG